MNTSIRGIKRRNEYLDKEEWKHDEKKIKENIRKRENKERGKEIRKKDECTDKEEMWIRRIRGRKG